MSTDRGGLTGPGASNPTKSNTGVWLEDTDCRIHHGDALQVLRGMEDGSVHMCATSPPFWSLRDYQADGQIGLEPTVDEWVARLCDVFDEVRRVLRDDATLWVEIGDSLGNKQLVGQPWRLAFALQARGWFLRSEIIWAREPRPNPMPESVTDRPTKAHSTVFLLSKKPSYFYDQDAIREQFSLNTHSRGKGIGVKQEIEQRGGTGRAGRNNASFGHATKGDLAPHLTAPPQVETLEGLYECMVCGVFKSKTVGSAADGCGACGGELALVSGESPRGPDGRRVTAVKGGENSEQHRDGERWPNPSGANARSVWTIPTQPTPFAHFATFPEELVRRMILAGTSERGCCPECGAPWVRETARELVATRGNAHPTERSNPERSLAKSREYEGSGGVYGHYEVETLGWSPSCTCDINPLGGRSQLVRAPVPCTVLDPFGGSGTTALVARKHGRRSVLIELNSEYCELAASRLSQLSLLAPVPREETA